MLNLRKRKLLYILLSTICFCILLLIHSSIINHKNLSFKNQDWSFKSLSESFDFSYLPNLSDNLKESYNRLNLNSNNEELNEKGYILEPNNVKFKFLNRVKNKGNPQEIVENHNRKYKELLSTEVGKPQDASLIPPPSNEDLKDYKHANATIIALVRNEELSKIGQSIRRLQKSFNSKFNYPYTFINDQPFTDKFKKRILKYTEKAPVEFVQIPPQLWDKPNDIDTNKESKNMQILYDHDVAYAKKGSYHNMCRFYSGQFYNVPELQKYKYYWRIEPHVQFYSDITYDVFKYMESTEKIYGFTISLYDIDESLKSLWPNTLKYLNMDNNYKYVNPNGSFQWLVENLQNPKKNKVAGGYSTCHFWSNFEIGDMDFFRSEAYNNWFKYLDSTGNFYYERWGDAPIHSIGVSLFADKSKIHWFRDLGYSHDPYYHCANTPFTRSCNVGKFSRYEHLHDQNCLINWLEYDNIKNVY
ncbi:KTR4 [Candida pseudojiufengensis]|uniref:KTR4 n=1 Tax=Candida pseudojiufengensis TaxID=497109 RepID=UPI0022245C2F|nr:KTR4 [Candida pseudojiufengensis]KAI5960366.1 KTR4 [Candida pseudojiufengensis]